MVNSGMLVLERPGSSPKREFPVLSVESYIHRRSMTGSKPIDTAVSCLEVNEKDFNDVWDSVQSGGDISAKFERMVRRMYALFGVRSFRMDRQMSIS